MTDILIITVTVRRGSACTQGGIGDEPRPAFPADAWHGNGVIKRAIRHGVAVRNCGSFVVRIKAMVAVVVPVARRSPSATPATETLRRTRAAMRKVRRARIGVSCVTGMERDRGDVVLVYLVTGHCRACCYDRCVAGGWQIPSSTLEASGIVDRNEPALALTKSGSSSCRPTTKLNPLIGLARTITNETPRQTSGRDHRSMTHQMLHVLDGSGPDRQEAAVAEQRRGTRGVIGNRFVLCNHSQRDDGWA